MLFFCAARSSSLFLYYVYIMCVYMCIIFDI